MKSNNPLKSVKINITTYGQSDSRKRNKMDRHRNNVNPKFICSICLNTKPKLEDENIENKRKTQSCSVCKRHCDTTYTSGSNNKEYSTRQADDKTTKNVQTSNTDVSQGLNLLNEVLTVFQSKKHMDVKSERTSKTVMVKDASVSTCGSVKPKLTLSKIFQYSINDCGVCENGKFSIVNSFQPETNSQYSIDLIKHKSSSIPQMKMDQLKNSLKEKTKSRDAIEEVNRMFATVKKVDRSDITNRPKIRNGPRVLPVVKTNTFTATHNKSEDNFNALDGKTACKCCENNFYMSSGDSLAKQDCCQRKCGNERSDKGYYSQYHRCDMSAEFMVCDKCKNTSTPLGHYENQSRDYF